MLIWQRSLCEQVQALNESSERQGHFPGACESPGLHFTGSLFQSSPRQVLGMAALYSWRKWVLREPYFTHGDAVAEVEFELHGVRSNMSSLSQPPHTYQWPWDCRHRLRCSKNSFSSPLGSWIFFDSLMNGWLGRMQIWEAAGKHPWLQRLWFGPGYPQRFLLLQKPPGPLCQPIGAVTWLSLGARAEQSRARLRTSATGSQPKWQSPSFCFHQAWALTYPTAGQTNLQAPFSPVAHILCAGTRPDALRRSRCERMETREAAEQWRWTAHAHEEQAEDQFPGSASRGHQSIRLETPGGLGLHTV